MPKSDPVTPHVQNFCIFVRPFVHFVAKSISARGSRANDTSHPTNACLPLVHEELRGAEIYSTAFTIVSFIAMSSSRSMWEQRGGKASAGKAAPRKRVSIQAPVRQEVGRRENSRHFSVLGTRQVSQS